MLFWQLLVLVRLGCDGSGGFWFQLVTYSAWPDRDPEGNPLATTLHILVNWISHINLRLCQYISLVLTVWAHCYFWQVSDGAVTHCHGWGTWTSSFLKPPQYEPPELVSQGPQDIGQFSIFRYLSLLPLLKGQQVVSAHSDVKFHYTLKSYICRSSSENFLFFISPFLIAHPPTTRHLFPQPPPQEQWFPFPSLMCISMVTKGFADKSSCAEPWDERKREVSVSQCFEESGSQRLYGNQAKCAPLPGCPGASCPDRLGSIPWKCCSSGDYIPDASQSLLGVAALHFAVASWVLSSMIVKLSGGRSLLWKLKENEAPTVST